MVPDTHIGGAFHPVAVVPGPLDHPRIGAVAATGIEMAGLGYLLLNPTP